MQAYEFLAKPKNGTILIPEEFRNRITSDVKVIVLEMKLWTFPRLVHTVKRLYLNYIH